MMKPFGIIAVAGFLVKSPEIAKTLAAKTSTGYNLEIFM